MPDDSSGEGIKQKPVKQVAEREMTESRTPPDNPPTPPAQSVANQSVKDAVQAIEDRVRRAEWLMIGLTAAIALFALGSVIVGILQWRVMSGQLGEMKSGGTDTHNLAVAAGKQADAAKIQSDNTATLAGAAKDEVAKLQGQIMAMQKQTEVSQRPWVSAGGIAIKQPLTFDPVKGGSMSISYALRNTGYSPAFHVMWRSKLIVLSMVKDMGLEIRDARLAMCSPLRKRSRDLFDWTIFPGDVIPQSEDLNLPRMDIDAAMKRRDTGPFAHKGFISEIVIACVDYQLSFAAEHHQTRYAFMLGVPSPNGFSYMADFKPEGIPPGLKLIYWGQSAD